MERVVVTGIGMVTPVGLDTESTWQSLMAGKSGVSGITQFPITDEYPTRIAAEVRNFDPTRFMEKKKLKEVTRFIPFSLAATHMALEHSGLELTEALKERMGVFVGVGLGGLEGLEECAVTCHTKGPKRVSPYFIPSLIANMAAGQVSIKYGLRGPSLAHTSACASSAHSIGEAFKWIQYGRAPAMLAGGAEATITRIGIAGFSAMFALSRRNDDPERASRPWDRGRDGFVCGEGGCTLVLESLSHAKSRGARILAEIKGYGTTCDAYHITKPVPEGVGAMRAMKLALEDAMLTPESIDYVNAHGTSTPTGDTEEARAIARIYGEHATSKRLWVSSTKSMMGHLLGAAGAVEMAVCIKAIETGMVPPTINLEDPEADLPIDCVPNQARARSVRHAMSNSFGFGGTNVSLVVSAFED